MALEFGGGSHSTEWAGFMSQSRWAMLEMVGKRKGQKVAPMPLMCPSSAGRQEVQGGSLGHLL